MTDLIIYLIKAFLIQGFFFLAYWVFLRKSKRHTANRLFLLSGLLLSFCMPFLDINLLPDAQVINQDNPVNIWLLESSSSLSSFELIPVSPSHELSFFIILPLLYLAVILFKVIKSAGFILALRRLKKNSTLIIKPDYRLFRTKEGVSFSFFSNIFIPERSFGSKEFHSILLHEEIHVRNFHSIDRLLLNALSMVFWFNPLIHLFRKELILIHEYQADEGVIRGLKNALDYQEVLFAQVQPEMTTALANHFNLGMMKSRIIMLNKEGKGKLRNYFLLIPTLLTLMLIVSSWKLKTDGLVTGELAEILEIEESLKVLDKEGPAKDIPSIMPLKTTGKVKMTSGFGNRTDPISHEVKKHKGADFSCELGTQVLATANGIVKTVIRQNFGHGNMVILNHPNGFETKYAQLQEILVEEGEQVKQGQCIALSGNSGRSTGPHLHYEVLQSGEHVDPLPYIKDYEPGEACEVNPSQEAPK